MPAKIPQRPGTTKRSHRPTVEDVMSDTLTPLANEYWAPGAKNLKPFDPAVIQDIYKKELSTFMPGRVTILEFSQYFEK